MTDETPKRTRNASSPIGPGEAFDRIADLRDSRETRRNAIIAAFDAEEAAKEHGIAERVPAASQDRLAIMLRAYTEAQKEAAETIADKEPRPDWLDAPAPPVDRIEVDRSTGEARRVGAGRAK